MASMLPTLIEQATLPVRATIKSIKLRTTSKTIYLINRILQNILFFLYKPGHLISNVQIYKNLKMKIKRKRKKKQNYLGIELHLPNFRRRSFKSSNAGVGVHIEHSNEAIERCRRGDGPGRMRCNRNDAEAVTSVGALQGELVRLPKLNCLVE